MLPFDRLEKFFQEDAVEAESWISESDFTQDGWYNLPDKAWNKVVLLINEKKSPGYPRTLTCRTNAECLLDQVSLRRELEVKIDGLYQLGIALIPMLNMHDYAAFTSLNDPLRLKSHALGCYRAGIREFVQLTDKGEGRIFGKLQRLVCAVDLTDNNVERLIFGDWLQKSMDKEMGETCMAPRLDIMSDEEKIARYRHYEEQAADCDGLTSTDQPGFEYGVQLQDYMDHMFKALHDHGCLILDLFQDGENDYIEDSALARVIVGFYYSNISRIYVTNEGKLFVNTIPGIQVSGRFMTFKLNSDIRAMRSFTANVWLPAVLAYDQYHLMKQHFAHDVTPNFRYTLLARSDAHWLVNGSQPEPIEPEDISLPNLVKYTMSKWFCETAGDDCIEKSAYRTVADFERAYRWFGWNVTDTVVQKGEYDFCSTKFTATGGYQTGVWKAVFVRCYKNTEVTDLLNFFLPFRNHPDFCAALARVVVAHPQAVIGFARDYCGMVDDEDLRAIEAYGKLVFPDQPVPDYLRIDWYYRCLSCSGASERLPLTTEMKDFLDLYSVAEVSSQQARVDSAPKRTKW